MLAQRRRLLVEDLVEDGRNLGALKGPLESEQLEGQDAEREEIGAGVVGAAADLLGSEVGGGPEGDAGLGQRLLVLGELGDAEVHDLGGVVFEDPDVRRLDVAMHDAARVRVLESAGDLHQVEELLRQAQELAALDLAIEILAGEVLLDEVGDAVLESEVVDRDDVAVVEIAGDLGLAHEALAGLGVLRGAGLDRHVALDEWIVRLVDDAEAANAYLFKDLVLVQSLH